MNDLFLHYRFTDRGGVDVFDVYLAVDAKKRQNKLTELRVPLRAMLWKENDARLCDGPGTEDALDVDPIKPTGHGTG